MASREEEKRRRREERLALEKQAEAAQRRRRTLGIVAAAVLGAAAVAAVVIALVAGGDGNDPGGGGDDRERTAERLPAIPAQRIRDLDQAVERAGCEFRVQRSEGRDHVETEVEYDQNPPTSGPHDPVPAEDGVYDAGDTPPTENLVHSLEHGRVHIQYSAEVPRRERLRLETLANEENLYHVLLYENDTEMDAAVAATAWTRSLTCPEMNDRVFDAIRAFRTRFTDKGPEFVP